MTEKTSSTPERLKHSGPEFRRVEEIRKLFGRAASMSEEQLEIELEPTSRLYDAAERVETKQEVLDLVQLLIERENPGVGPPKLRAALLAVGTAMGVPAQELPASGDVEAEKKAELIKILRWALYELRKKSPPRTEVQRSKRAAQKNRLAASVNAELIKLEPAFSRLENGDRDVWEVLKGARANSSAAQILSKLATRAGLGRGWTVSNLNKAWQKWGDE